MDIAESIETCLHSAGLVEQDLVGCNCKDKLLLDWLENQLKAIIISLQILLSDIESGLSIQDSGFFGEDDFSEMIDDMNMSIASLKGKIRNLREIGR